MDDMKIVDYISLLCLCSCFGTLPALADEGYRTFTSKDGSTINAKVIEADADSVTIRFPDGRTFKDVDLKKFSNSDRKYIKKWLAREKERTENAEISVDSKLEITFLRGRDDDENNYGDIDDRVVRFEPAVVLKSGEVYQTYTGIIGSVVIVGREILQRKRLVIMSKQDFKMKALAPGDEVRWNGKGFECRYDPDYGGFEYGGYLLVLRDRSGKIVKVKSSRTAWAESPEVVLKAKKQTGYNSDFSRNYTLYSTWGLPQ